MTPAAPETNRWRRPVRRLAPVLLALALTGMIGWVALGPDEDPTAKALAQHVARAACGGSGELFSGSTVIEDDSIPAISDPAARLAARRAESVSNITSEDGFADAGTFLLGFASSSDLDAAIAAVTETGPGGRLCLLDSELFTPGFGSDGAFATTCSALGGIELGSAAATAAPERRPVAAPAQRRST
jgi:hypothetical protein